MDAVVNRAALKRSLEQADRAAFAERFYAHLFDLAPETQALFHGDPQAMRLKFTLTLRAIVDGLDRRNDLSIALRTLGTRHTHYGVNAEAYAAAGEALLRALRDCLGEAFTPELETEWRDAYAGIVAGMVGPAE